MPPDAVQAAAERAAGPQPLWAIVPAASRARSIRRAARVVLDELDALAGLLAVEAGLPRTEALLAELLPTVGALHALADDGPRAIAARRIGRIPLLRAGRRAAVLHAPAGVVGIAGGDASPFAELLLEVAAALLAGNGVVMVPAIAAPGERVRAVLVRAGIPGELVQVLHGPEAAAGLEDVCDTVVAAVPAGDAGTMLVLRNAPVARTVDGALWAAFAGAGQSPAAVGRLIVPRAQADALVDGITAGAGRLRVGDPRAPDTEIGPLRTADRAALVAELVEDAVARGATLVCGGRGSATLVSPVVLRDVPLEARVQHEPVPGPVLAVTEVADERAAIALAREATGAVSVWSGDRGHGDRIARTLPAELTWVNEHGFTEPSAAVRIARHVEVHQLASQPARLRGARRLPYDPELVVAATAAARLRHGRESERAATLRDGALPLARVTVRLAREALRR
jgi:acyl-CoA reductase-like NAD-dependent aldehyde dehydrogenase